jgi:hypothetical protein
VLLAGAWQVFAAGRVHVLLGALQGLATARQVLSVFVTQVSAGKLQTLSVPRQGLAANRQVCPVEQSLLRRQDVVVPEQVPREGGGQSESTRQVSPVTWQVL